MEVKVIFSAFSGVKAIWLDTFYKKQNEYL